MDKINFNFEKQKEYFYSFETKSISFRLEQLKKLKVNLLKYEKEISQALNLDLGKSETQSFLSEIGPCISEINYFLKNLKKISKDKKVNSSFLFPLSKSYIKYDPYGIVLIISPWNYPINLTFLPIIGAIAAGNCCFVKPSEISQNCSKIIKKIIEDTFESKFVCVFEGGAEITQDLLLKKFDYIFYTGGEKVGKIIMQKASENLIPVTLELGGKSPCVVDKNCDIKKTAKRIVFGKFINSGQTCIAPDYLLVDKKIKNKLVQEIIEQIKIQYKETSIDYGKIINLNHTNRLNEYLQEENVKILNGGEVNFKENKISPTLIDNINIESKIMQEEIFGPILPIIEFEDLEYVINLINSKPKPLALYIFSKDKQFQKELLNKTSSGGVCINDTIIHIGNNNLPFGGVGNSGIGAYHGFYSFETFSHKKSILKNTLLFEIPFRYAPYSKNSLLFLKKIFK